MGYGIYQYSGTGIYSTAFRKQQQVCYPVPDQYYPSDRRNIYGYDTGLPDLHTNLPAGMYCTWNDNNPFRYHDDLQPVYRNNHTTGWNNTVCWC